MSSHSKKYFGPDGKLAEVFSSFEPRQGQMDMADAVYGALTAERFDYQDANVLIIEAETGIGKSLAYLLPAVVSGKKIVVSTATINLQDQIIKKEVPLLQQTLGQEIPVACIKGRQNYLCYYRWYQYRSSRQLTLVEDDICDKIDEWLLQTETGDRAELSWLQDHSPLWPRISAQSHQCLGSDCPEASSCFVNELRRKAGSARLLVVNHHLFFSDLALKKSGFGEVLPRYEGVVFDEAHHLENIASTFFGKSFSQFQVLDLVSDIENQAEADLPPSMTDKMVSSARGIRQRVEQFTQIFPSERGRFPLVDFIENRNDWYDEVKNLSSGLERVTAELKELEAHGEGWKSLVKRCSDLQNNLVEIALPDVIMDEGAHVHWYERRERSVSLSATPISVAENLRTFLYPSVDCCVLTSATLTTGGSFSYVCERLGLDEEVTSLRLQSPFDYSKNTCLYIPGDNFPLPSEKRYSDELCRQIFELVMASKGRALILCTSFRGLDAISEYLEENSLPYPLLVQGRASRHALLQQFKKITESVLVAVASFWEGVDVPGDSLSCVIIDKLPFEVPSDPVLQARILDIKESGGNPFFDFQVPRAILSLRQGVGRLMRSSRDKGVIAIMDTRLYKKGYGRTFRASLPPSPTVRNLSEIKGFFEKLEKN